MNPQEKTHFTGCIIIIIFVGIILLIFLVHQDLNVKVNILKNGDSSAFWITNEESEPITLIEVKVNDEYIMDTFPNSTDTYIPGRGRKYLQPNEQLMFFTEYFHDGNGKIFDSQNTAIIKITVYASEGSGIFSFRSYSGKL